jgi:hypothetical protein
MPAVSQKQRALFAIAEHALEVVRKEPIFVKTLAPATPRLRGDPI